MPKRYTYSAVNAEAFRKLFESMKDGKDRMISSQVTGYTRNTLHLKAGDALRWLAVHEGEWFQTLRDRIRIRKTDGGIVLAFAKSHEIVSSLVNADPWMVDLQLWLDKSKTNDSWQRHGVAITSHQRQLLEKLLSKYEGVEWEVDGTTLRVVR